MFDGRSHRVLATRVILLGVASSESIPNQTQIVDIQSNVTLSGHPIFQVLSVQSLCEQSRDQDEKTVNFPHGAANLVNSVEWWYYQHVIFQETRLIQCSNRLRNVLNFNIIHLLEFIKQQIKILLILI
jgi:hypothetical protein